MKLTKSHLRKIIKEELASIAEGRYDHDEEGEYRYIEDEDDWADDPNDMDQETYEVYDQAIRLGRDRIVKLIAWLADYRDNPESARKG